MTPDAFDNDMKKILEDTQYVPSDTAWLKVQIALNEKEVKPTPLATITKRRLFTPLQWTAAASVAGLLMATAIYFMPTTQSSKELVQKDVTTSTSNIVKEDALELVKAIQPAIQATVDYNSNDAFTTLTPKQNAHHLTDINKGTKPIFVNDNNAQTLFPKVEHLGILSNKIEQLPIQSVAISEITMPIATENKSKKNTSSASLNTVVKTYAVDWANDPDEMSSFEDPFVYGLSVKAGFPTVGNMQFNSGLTIKKDIGTKFFTQANLDVSYTDVRYEKALYYKENDNGIVTNLGSSANALAASGTTTNTYENHVFGVGLAPVVGMYVTKNVSIAVGADMYRNFNNNLVLKSNPMVEETALKQTVAPLKWVSVWDAGVRAQLGLKLTEHVDLVAQYRKGLVNYMMDAGGKVVKNSSLSLGLNVSFNP